MYPEDLVMPMKKQLTDYGFEELISTDELLLIPYVAAQPQMQGQAHFLVWLTKKNQTI